MGWVCDGSSAWGNASWGADCADSSDEDLDFCCAEGYYDSVICSNNGWTATGDGDTGDGDTGSSVTLCLTDSYGDSWNGNTLTVNGVTYDQPALLLVIAGLTCY